MKKNNIALFVDKANIYAMKIVKKNINSFVIHTKQRQECFLLVWLKGLKSEVSSFGRIGPDALRGTGFKLRPTR